MKLPIVALLLCLAWAGTSYGESFRGRVVGISDGDTITVLDSSKTQYKIRLAGIDAPEMSQPFGERSKQHLSELVFGKPVTVDWNKTDKYGRTVGKILADGQDINLRQIQLGLAWHYKQYQNEQSASDRSAYAQAEIEAKSRQIGLWRDATPTSPWDYRHNKVGGLSSSVKPIGETCSCNSNLICTGPKGGRFCVTAGGKKRYL